MYGHKRIPSREGGVEIVVEELSTRMVSMGHDVVCYNRTGHHVSGSEFDNEGLAYIKEYKGVKIKKVFTLDKKGLAAVTSSFAAAVKCAFSKCTTVHIHAQGPALTCFLPKLFGKQTVVTVHGLDWQREKWKKGFGSKYIHMGEKCAVRYADEIIVLSKNVQDYFLNAYGRKTTLIPNGVNMPDRLDANLITKQFSLEKDGYILFLGRLVPEKGIHYLINAFLGINTDKKLVIAGGASDSGAYVEELKKLSANDDRVIFTGFVCGDMLAELYSNAYIYVLPSDLEGMPLSLLEAMSYSNCCLTSDIPECAEVIEDCGATFNKGNVEDLQKRLNELLNDKEKTAFYKQHAREFICSKYSWEKTVQKTLELYR